MTSNSPSRTVAVAEATATAHCLVRDGTITYANPAMGRLFDAEPSDLEGSRLLDLVDRDDRERVADALDEASEDPETVQFDAEREGRDPMIVESEWTETDDGEVWTLVGSLRDVTERARRRERFERESEMLDSLLEHIPMSVYFKDRQSRHERVSQHMICPEPDSCIVGPDGKHHHHPEDIHGKTDFDLYDPEFAAEAVEDDRRVIEDEETVYDEVTGSTTPLGERYYCSTTKVPRYDAEGDVVGLVGVTMDITDRMTYERELERQNERLEEFTEVLAHDLRNPLSVAKANVELLRDRDECDHLAATEESIDRMSNLIDEIRTYIIEGRPVESPQAVHLPVVARDAWDSVDTGEATLDVTASHRIRADTARLRQLLENVFRNSIEHGTDDGTAVTVTVGDLERGFYVADDGPGVPDDLKDEVFDRGVSTTESGTGFGLAIVEDIAEAHDWSVAVTDAEDDGARFEFTGVVRVEDGAESHS